MMWCQWQLVQTRMMVSKDIKDLAHDLYITELYFKTIRFDSLNGIIVGQRKVAMYCSIILT